MDDGELMAEVRSLVAKGAAEYNAGRFWEAHEDWEEAWHLLRDDGQGDRADHLQGLILATAAFENLSRGKPAGFRVQMAKALHRLRRHADLWHDLGLADEAAFREALLDVYLDVMRQKLTDLDGLTQDPPHLELTR